MKPTILHQQPCATDFTIPSISGVFRACVSETSLDEQLTHIAANQAFFDAIDSFSWGQTTKLVKYHDSWEWREYTHPLLANGYKLNKADSQRSSSFNRPDLKQMRDCGDKYGKIVSFYGLILQISLCEEERPVNICYFFPWQKRLGRPTKNKGETFWIPKKHLVAVSQVLGRSLGSPRSVYIPFDRLITVKKILGKQ